MATVKDAISYDGELLRLLNDMLELRESIVLRIAV